MISANEFMNHVISCHHGEGTVPGKKTFAKPRVSPYPVGLGVGAGVPQGVNLVVDAYWDTAGNHRMLLV